MANSRTITQIMAEITVLYPLMFTPTTEQTAIWTMYLRDLDDELLINALHHYVATAKDNYPPSVPALRRAASELRRKAAGVPTAFEAWENLLETGDGSPILKITDEKDGDGRCIIEHIERRYCHPLVEQTARQLGWPKFPRQEDIEIERAHFFKAYEAGMGKLTEEDRELPEVRAFIEKMKQPELPSMNESTAGKAGARLESSDLETKTPRAG